MRTGEYNVVCDNGRFGAHLYGADSLTEGVVQAYKMRRYYVDIGRVVENLYVERLCLECDGQGEVYKSRKRGLFAKRRQCRACKGRGIMAKVSLISGTVAQTTKGTGSGKAQNS